MSLYDVEGIDFRYGAKKVIDALTVTLAAGHFYGIVGPNGSGKSTLLDLLLGHRRPSRGDIRFRGRPLAAFARRALAREIALVPQDYHINFPFSAREVVMMGRYPHLPRFAPPSRQDREVVARIMDQTGTRRLAERLVTELSGGERQRVVFARALAQQTPVLILDEAFSNLDIQYALLLLELAAQRVRRHGATVLAVLQNINQAAMFCDRLLFIKDGRVAAAGPLDEVLTPGLLERVFDVQARVFDDPFTGSRQVALRRRSRKD